MKVMAFNGSPRKKWNTATLLKKAIEGAESKGAEASITNLYDLNYKGCISCFVCKTREAKSYGACAVKDDLAPILAEIKKSDVLLFGSPIYFGDVTGEMRSFMERLLFPYLVYAQTPQTLFPGKIRTGWIYTMNVDKQTAVQLGYDRLFEGNESLMQRIFSHSESMMSYDTYQFEDYSNVVADRFDVAQKEKVRQEQFPKDCQKAYEMGVALVVTSG